MLILQYPPSICYGYLKKMYKKTQIRKFYIYRLLIQTGMWCEVSTYRHVPQNNCVHYAKLVHRQDSPNFLHTSNSFTQVLTE